MGRNDVLGSRVFVAGNLWAIILCLSFPSGTFAANNLEEYLRAFEDEHGEVRRAALEQVYACERDRVDGYEPQPECPTGIGRQGHRRLLAAIIDLLADPDPKIRVLAVGYLKSSSDAGVIEPMARLLQDPNDEVRAAAADSFYSRTVDDPIVQELELLLDDRNKRVRMNAAGSLGLSGKRRTLDLLRDKMTREPDDEVLMLYEEVVKELEYRFRKNKKRQPLREGK